MGLNCLYPLTPFSTTQSTVGWIHRCGTSDTKQHLWDLSFLPFWYLCRFWSQSPVDTEGWLYFFFFFSQFQSKNNHFKLAGSPVMANLLSWTCFNLLPSWISFPTVLLSSRRILPWIFITRNLEKCWGWDDFYPFPSRKFLVSLCRSIQSTPELYSPRGIWRTALIKFKKNKILPVTSSPRAWGIVCLTCFKITTQVIFFFQNKEDWLFSVEFINENYSCLNKYNLSINIYFKNYTYI